MALLVALLAMLTVLSLAAIGSEFKGADDAAEEAIVEIAPGVEPWFAPLWSPPDERTEQLLFALQAAAGAGVMGYFFALKRHATH